MGMVIDLQYLLATIKKAPKAKKKELMASEKEVSISGYVLEHFLLPFLCGDMPCTAELDFENIDEGDMEETGEAAEVLAGQSEGFLQIWIGLQQAEATAESQNLFF